jgi:hypothetical protein
METITDELLKALKLCLPYAQSELEEELIHAGNGHEPDLMEVAYAVRYAGYIIDKATTLQNRRNVQ